MTASIGTQASVLAGLLALIVALSVDSIQEGDNKYYRVFVAALGLGSLGPIFVVLTFSVLQPAGSINQTRATTFSVLSLLLILCLLVGTIIVESGRGLDNSDLNWYMIGLGIVVLTWYLVLLLLF